jgi:hypothetical protein
VELVLLVDLPDNAAAQLDTRAVDVAADGLVCALGRDASVTQRDGADGGM